MNEDRSAEYDQFIQSKLWQEIRLKALAHYGCVCNSCKSHGTDVHHKTYARFGGHERMEDLMILCRQCHDALHRAAKSARHSFKKKKTRRMEPTAIFHYLNSKQRRAVMDMWDIPNEAVLYLKVTQDKAVSFWAGSLLGVVPFQDRFTKHEFPRKRQKNAARKIRREVRLRDAELAKRKLVPVNFRAAA